MTSSDNKPTPEPLRKRDQAFFITLVVFSILGLPMVYYSYKLNIYGKQNAPKDYDWPTSIEELWKAPFLSLVLYYIQLNFEKAVTPFFYSICKVKDDEEMRNERAHKSANRFFKCTYYTVLVIVEVYLFSD